MGGVAIVGLSPNTMRKVERLFGEDWEFWGINQLNVSFPEFAQHATAWFQIHDLDDLIETDHKHIQTQTDCKRSKL